MNIKRKKTCNSNIYHKLTIDDKYFIEFVECGDGTIEDVEVSDILGNNEWNELIARFEVDTHIKKVDEALIEKWILIAQAIEGFEEKIAEIKQAY